MRETGTSINPDQMDNSEKKVSRRGFLKKLGKGVIGIGIAASSLDQLAQASELEQKKEKSPEEIEMLRKWGEYKRIVKDSGIKENIKYIEETFGESGSKIVGKAKFDLALFDQLERDEIAGEDLVADPSRKDLLKAAIADFDLFWNEETFKKLATETLEHNKKRQPVIAGFENLPGQSNESISHMLDTKFDPHWAYGNISSFIYDSRGARMRTFEVAGMAQNEGLGGVFYKSGNERVILYKTDLDQYQDHLLAVLSHEIGHHNDWQDSNALTIHERLEFLSQIGRRLSSPDRFKSPYVESDIPAEYEALTPGEIRYRQAREYWATIVEKVDLHEEDMRKARPKDYELVRRWRDLIISRYKE